MIVNDDQYRVGPAGESFLSAEAQQKLILLEERVNLLLTERQALWERKQVHVESAAWHRVEATSHKNVPPEMRHAKIADLAELTREQCVELWLRWDEIQLAMRESAAAARLDKELARREPSFKQQSVLLERLKRYASNVNLWAKA